MRLRCRTTCLLTSFPPDLWGHYADPRPGRACEAEEGAVGERNRAIVVEVEPSGLTWRKSTASGSSGSACVEAASLPNSVLIRNSRNRKGARLSFRYLAWKALLASVRDLTR
jgi:uncharacterized protein DUF397